MRAEQASSSLLQHLGVQVVIAAGVVSSALTTAGIYLLDTRTDDLNVMGWYLWYILPAGAIIVGMAAGSGYALASWVTGTRVGGGLLAAVLLLQSAAFLGMHYAEFRTGEYVDRRSGEPMGFVQYADAMARSFRFKKKEGDPGGGFGGFGAFGYVYLGLQALGFVGGGLAAPLMLRTKPYCDACGLYKRSKELLVLPGAPDARPSGPSSEEAWSSGLALLESALMHAANETRASEQGFDELRAAHGPHRKRYLASSHRIVLQLVSCRRCGAGELVGIARVGTGENVKETELSRIVVPQSFARRHAA